MIVPACVHARAWCAHRSPAQLEDPKACSRAGPVHGTAETSVMAFNVRDQCMTVKMTHIYLVADTLQIYIAHACWFRRDYHAVNFPHHAATHEAGYAADNNATHSNCCTTSSDVCIHYTQTHRPARYFDNILQNAVQARYTCSTTISTQNLVNCSVKAQQ